MPLISIDIINYICELAAGKDKSWYPCFSPKTGKISWKVNSYCQNWIYSSTKFLNPIREIYLTLYNIKTNEEIEKQCKLLLFNNPGIFYINKFYIEFDLDDSNSRKFMLRGMIDVFNHNIKEGDSLYLNGIKYAAIDSGWAPNLWNKTLPRMVIKYETYETY